MRLPVLLAVDEDRDALDDVKNQLVQRYAHDYRIESAAIRMRRCGRCRSSRTRARTWRSCSPPRRSSTSGGHLLEHVRQLHPHAGRALLVPDDLWSDQPTADAIRDSMALGRIDYYVAQPAGRLDEVFHEAVSSFLLEWARDRQRHSADSAHRGRDLVRPGLRAEGGLRAMRGRRTLSAWRSRRRGASCSPGRPDAKLPLMALPDGRF